MDEEQVEEELRKAESSGGGHTPWVLVGLGVGGGLLALIVLLVAIKLGLLWTRRGKGERGQGEEVQV